MGRKPKNKSLLVTDFSALEPSSPIKFDQATGEGKEECLEIASQLQTVLKDNVNLLAISAPQIGINKRLFCIKFNDQIKTFINPIIIKKVGSIISPETCANFPNKEILIARPQEVTVVYYTQEFKYEENKLLDMAARLFDQQIQFLDGITPVDLGLVSEPETDGSLFDLSDDEIVELQNYYREFIKTKLNAYENSMTDEEDKKIYANLKFTESVINGRTQVIQDEPKKKPSFLGAWEKTQAANVRRNSLKQFLRRKSK